jgi:hypothetical protein
MNKHHYSLTGADLNRSLTIAARKYGHHYSLAGAVDTSPDRQGGWRHHCSSNWRSA